MSGLTFQEWTPNVDTSRPPVTMLINSNEGFKFKEVLPPVLEALHVVVCTHEDRDCDVLRVWVLKDLFYQWMTTLNSGHDVSKYSRFFTMKFSIFPINLF